MVNSIQTGQFAQKFLIGRKILHSPISDKFYSLLNDSHAVETVNIMQCIAYILEVCKWLIYFINFNCGTIFIVMNKLNTLERI